MNVVPVKTRRVTAGEISLEQLLDEYVTDMTENSILAITSKIVSLCENSVKPMSSVDREDLIVQEADKYLPSSLSRYKHHFTIKDHTLIAGAGIDESNGNDHFILWPRNSQETANTVRKYLKKRFSLTHVGVLITDSTCQPLRLGTAGICLAHSGFAALRDYIGQPDLFGRPFGVTQANIASGLAASAVVVMGEGSEQTPLAILSDLSFVGFQNRDPLQSELDLLNFDVDEDLFAPFLNAVEWKKGKG